MPKQITTMVYFLIKLSNIEICRKNTEYYGYHAKACEVKTVD